MLYWLFYEKLFRHFTPFRVFQYTTFRTAFAALTSLFLCLALGPWLIAKLREFQIGQYIREEGPKSHMKKAGTPTMGGILIIISILIPTLLWANLVESVRVDRDVQPGELRADRFLGRLRQGSAQTESGPDGESRNSGCRSWPRCWSASCCWRCTPRKSTPPASTCRFSNRSSRIC